MARHEDPDAIWKPGYDGPIRYDGGADTAGAPRRPRRRISGLAVLGTVVASAALVTAGVVVLTGDRHTHPDPDATETTIESRTSRIVADGAGPSAAAAPVPSIPLTDRQALRRALHNQTLGGTGSARPWTFPASVDRRWTASVAGTTVGEVAAVAGTHDTVLMVLGRPASIGAFEASDGRPRWSAPAPGPAITAFGVVDGIVVVAGVTSSGSGRVRAFDLDTGVIAWQRPTRAFERVHVGEVVLVERLRSDRGRPAGVELVDPRTGSVQRRVERLDGSVVVVGPTTVQRIGEHAVEWFEHDGLELTRAASPGVLGDADLGRVRSAELLFLDVVAVRRDVTLVIRRLGASDGSDGDDHVDDDGDDDGDRRGQRIMGGTVTEQAPGSRPVMIAVDTPDGVAVVEFTTGRIVQSGRRPGRSVHVDGYVLASTGSMVLRDGSATGASYDGLVTWTIPLAPGAVANLVDGAVVVVTPVDGGIEVQYHR